MELDTRPTGSCGPTITTTESLGSLRLNTPDLYSVVPYPEDHWSRAQSRRCFKTDESAVQVTFTDVDAENNVAIRTLDSLAELRRYRSAQMNGLRIVSLNQRNSWRPLNVTQEMFQEIVDIAGASSDILELSLSFFQKSIGVEEGFIGAPLFRSNHRSIEIAYILKYAGVKPIEEKGKDNWVLRQTGVYQKYDIATKSSIWVLVHPTPGCEFQNRLIQFMRSPDQPARLQSNPLLIHSILLGTFFPLWRDYLAHYEHKMLHISNPTVAAQIVEQLRVNHESLTAIRGTENRCLVMQPIFRSLDKILEVLHQANGALSDCNATEQSEVQAMRQLLTNYSSMVNSYAQGAWSLQARAARIAAHITDTLSFKDAYVAKRQSDLMLRDSTTVRVITVVTLIYLPSSFMATLLGMNSFFEMDSDSHRLIISPQFWIYVVCSVPLTGATLLYWWFFQREKQHAEVMNKDVFM
ncbi:hypothetical protein ARAM_000212, partial [Aspergillus rambellii]